MESFSDYSWVLIPLTLILIGLYAGRKPSPGETKYLQDLEKERSKEAFFSSRFEVSDWSILERYRFYKKERVPIPADVRGLVSTKTKGRCFYCGKSLISCGGWQLDHIWPVRFGGTDDITNLVPSCVPCNKSKWAYSPLLFFLYKWVLQIQFTEFEREFIDRHRQLSLAYLLKSSHYKNCCDWWHSAHYQVFADLILHFSLVPTLTAEQRDSLIAKAEELYEDMELGRIANPEPIRESARSLVEKAYKSRVNEGRIQSPG